MKKIITILLIASVMLTAGCASKNASSSSQTADAAATDQETSAISGIMETEIFDEEVATLDNTTINLDEVNDNIVNITNAGNYILTGSFKGQIRVELNNDAQVKITLSNARIENEGSACIYFVNGDKLIISADDDTVNYLINTGAFIQTDNSKVDGAIFARDDLQVSGHGKIIISSEFGHGIVAKDDFMTKNVSVDITSNKKGIQVNDELCFKSGNYKIISGSAGIIATVIDINDGTIYIESGKDGIDASNGGGKGEDSSALQVDTVVYIRGGEVTINAGQDGIDSKGDLYISGGILTITSFGSEKNSAIDYRGKCEITGGVQHVPADFGLTNMHDSSFGGFM